MIKKYKPAELAEQICLWNQILFKNISSIEFLNQLWKDGEEKEFYSPNLTFFIQRFEKVCLKLFCFIYFLFYFIFYLKSFLPFRKVIGLPPKFVVLRI